MEIKSALTALQEAKESPFDVEDEIPTKIINTNQIPANNDQNNGVMTNIQEFSNDEEEEDEEQDEKRIHKEVCIFKSVDHPPEQDHPAPDFQSEEDVNMEVVSDKKNEKNRRFTDDESVNCSLCKIPFNDQDMFEDHMRQIHGKQNKIFTCQLCRKIFRNDQILQTHFSSAHKIETFMCSICSQMFLVEETYKKHKCGSSQIINSLKRKIVAPHEESMANKENIRPNGSKRSAGLEKSTEKEPGEIGDGKYMCRLCTKKFALSKNLSGHFKDKHGIDIYDCNKCGKIFLSEDLLEKHSRECHKSSPHQPLVRNMLPSTIQLTKIHNSKKIKCDICKQKFFTKLELQNHKDVIHTSFTVMDDEENYKIEEEFNLKNNPKGSSKRKKSIQKVTGNGNSTEMTDLDPELKIISINIAPEQSIHVIFYEGKKYITSTEASRLIPRFKGRDVLQKMLKLHKMQIIPFVAKKEACKELFEECIIEGVAGVENEFGEIANEVHLYELSCLPKIFDQFIPEANPELIQMYLKIKNFM